MKKHLPLIIMAVMALALNEAKAQEYDILYTHFNPPVTLLGQLNSDTLTIDFDEDGVADFGICWLDYPWTPYFISLGPDRDFMIHQVGDTSSLSSPDILWQHENGYISFDDAYEWGVRLKNGNAYYYGWAYSSAFSEPNPGMPHNNIYVALYDMAFCTIPSYPLHWGQTDLTGMDESLATTFATIHPNPTTGLVTVTGKDLKAAEVLNALGQCVAKAQGQGETLQIDMGKLPAGVYFVTVTDEEGRRCVRKVVRE